MQSENKIFKIYGAYEWYYKSKKDDEIDKKIKPDNSNVEKGKNQKSLKAINQIISQLTNNSLIKKSSIKIRYNRLRATAGSFLLEGIRDRIANCNVIIFDISGFNPNVMFELGIALEAAYYRENAAKIYLICEGNKFDCSIIPSDLSGYFISFYELIKDKVVFHDSNSLNKCLISDIADLINQDYIEQEN